MKMESIHGQQLPLYTQYRETQSTINPAFINMNYFNYDMNVSMGASYRAQWISVPNTPRTAVIHGEFIADMSSDFKLLTGGSIIHDQAGRLGLTGAYVRLGGVLAEDPDEFGVSAAISGGFVQYRLNLSNARVLDPVDIAATTDQNSYHPDLSVGVFGYYKIDEDVLYAGISVPQVFGLDIGFENDDNSELIYGLDPHYYGVVGYILNTNSELSFLEISSWVKYVKNVPIHADFNLRYQIIEFFWLGGGYSTSSIFHGEVGFTITDIGSTNNLLRIGYGFDSPFTKYARFGPAHEVNVSYAFKL